MNWKHSLFAIALPALCANQSGRTPRIPLVFEENVGQGPAGSRYLLSARGVEVAFDEHGWTLRAGNAKLTMSFQGSGCSRIEGLDHTPARVNYLLGNRPGNWHVDVPTNSRIRCAHAAPGLDIVYYLQGPDVEYDLIASPGSRTKELAFDIAGARDLRLDEAGNLVMRVDGREVRLKRPVAYQGKKCVPVRYLISANRRVRIVVGPHDTSERLVIDPVLELSTFLGGALNEFPGGVAVDRKGNIYVAGGTASSDFPTVGAIQGAKAGAENAFVAKLDPTGHQLIWSTYLGGSSSDQAYAIAVDRDGNPYIAGNTTSTDFPVSSGALQSQKGFRGSASTGFITKLNPEGNTLAYSTYFGGNATGNIYAMAVSERGEATVAGITYASQFPLQNPLQTNLRGYFNGFVSRLAADGSAVIYSTYLGGSSGDNVTGIALDHAGDTILAGMTNSTDFPIVNAVQPSLHTGPVFQSGNGGANWSVSNQGMVPALPPSSAVGANPLSVESFAVDPFTPTTLYAGTLTGVFKSIDQGASWSSQLTGMSTYRVYSLAADPTTQGTIYAGTQQNIYKSTDSGMTWQESGTGMTSGGVSVIVVDPSNSANVYAVAGNQIFRSANAGANWTASQTGIPANAQVYGLALSAANTSILYAGESTPGAQGGPNTGAV